MVSAGSQGYAAAMKPDPLTPSRQGTGQAGRDKTGKTVSPGEIPREHRAYEGVREGPTEDALPPGATEPVHRHRSRPERDKQGGAHTDPTKRR